MARKGENIYKRKDNRWEARYIKARGENGRAIYGYCYGKTYREVKKKVLEAQVKLTQSVPIPDEKPQRTFSEYCDEWLMLCRSRVKESTYVKYLSILEKHIKPGLGSRSPLSLTTAAIEGFSYGLLQEKGLSVKSVRDILTVLHGILRYIRRQDPRMPGIEVIYPKEEKREMRVLSVQEQEIFSRYLLKDMDESKFGVLLALMTGMRIGEICALRWGDVDLNEKAIHIRHTMQRIKNTAPGGDRKTKICITAPKSKRSVRDIPITQYTAELCAHWQEKDSAAFLLTGSKERFMEPRRLQYKMRQYTRACGLENVHFHTLRHTFATRCVEADFEIKSLSEILGHSSSTVTLERYVHSSMELKRSNMNKLPKLLP